MLDGFPLIVPAEEAGDEDRCPAQHEESIEKDASDILNKRIMIHDQGNDRKYDAGHPEKKKGKAQIERIGNQI